MASRKTQTTVETLVVGGISARTSQVAVETAITLNAPARTSQVAVETVVSPIIRNSPAVMAVWVGL